MAKAWFSMYSGDYLVKTASCSLLEQGAYIKLLLYYHQNDGLPSMQTQCKCTANAEQVQCKAPTNDLQESHKKCKPCKDLVLQVFRITGAFGDDEQNAVKSVLNNFFKWDGKTWLNERMDLELQKALGISETRSRSAKLRYEREAEKRKSAKKNEKKDPNKPLANALQMQSKTTASVTQSQSQSQSQESIKEKMNKKENHTLLKIQSFEGDTDFQNEFDMFEGFVQMSARLQNSKFKAREFWEHWEAESWKDTNQKRISLKSKINYAFQDFQKTGKSAYFGEDPKESKNGFDPNQAAKRTKKMIMESRRYVG